MFLQQVTVSRKTPDDGKLEISAATAAQLGTLPPHFPIVVNGREALSRLELLECTCAKAAGARHVHHFLVSPLFRTLGEGTELRLELDESTGVVRVQQAG